MVIEESDESGFWPELLVRIEAVKPAAVSALEQESSELVAIFTASRKTVGARVRKQRGKP